MTRSSRTSAGIIHNPKEPMDTTAEPRERLNAATAAAWVRAISAAVSENAEYLTRLDAAIGDADHGVNMRRGFAVAVTTLDAALPDTPGEVLVRTGTALVGKVGGVSGPLYGSMFRVTGRHLADAETVGPDELLEALEAGLQMVRRLGDARPGDKTMVDAFVPALDAFGAAVRDGADLARAARAAAHGAEEGMRATVSMVARKGRASYLGSRSRGHQDPGATSTALVFQALAEVLGG